MKRTLIATIVGTIIIFVFQALSWMVSPIHKNSFKHTDGQEAILSALSSTLQEDGMYYMPMLSPDAPHEEQEKFMNEQMGKPAATVSYVKAAHYNMGTNMACGFIFTFIGVWIIVFILTKASNIFNTMGSRVGVTLALSVLVVFRTYMMEWNWMNSPMHYLCGQIIDELLGGLLLGLWLGWYLGRTPKAAS